MELQVVEDYTFFSRGFVVAGVADRHTEVVKLGHRWMAGSVRGVPGSHVRLTLHPDGTFSSMIMMPGAWMVIERDDTGSMFVKRLISFIYYVACLDSISS